jgi:hypothetical protein
VPGERLDAADTVRAYKRLSDVERAFRALKTIDFKVRPTTIPLHDASVDFLLRSPAPVAIFYGPTVGPPKKDEKENL